MAITGAMRRPMAQNHAEFDPRRFVTDAIAAAMELCQLRFEAFGFAGQASKIQVISLADMAQRYKNDRLDPVSVTEITDDELVNVSVLLAH